MTQMPNNKPNLSNSTGLNDADVEDLMVANDFRWSQGGYWIHDKYGAFSPEQATFIHGLVVDARLDEHDKVLDAFIKMIEGRVIKEDEPYNTSPKSSKSPLIKTRYRNDLRKQQRQALKLAVSQLTQGDNDEDVPA